MKHSRYAAAAAFCAVSLFATGASAAPLNVRTGLWESTYTTRASGAPLPGMGTHKYRSCLTKKQLAEDPAAEPPQPGESCVTKIVSQTSKHWKGRRLCTSSIGKREFYVDVRALSRERTRGTVRVVFSEGGQSFAVNGKLASRWLSSNCGSVQ